MRREGRLDYEQYAVSGSKLWGLGLRSPQRFQYASIKLFQLVGNLTHSQRGKPVLFDE